MNLKSGSSSSNSENSNVNFIENIINGMSDWVRVLDRDDNIIYINREMADATGSCFPGQKCYQAIGRSQPCENCTSRRAIFNGQRHEKEEIINDRIFSVASSPVKDENGQITAVVEVLRDITQMKKLQQKVMEQNKKLKDNLDIAKKLQCSLLPQALPEGKVKFAYTYNPSETLGGDFFDIFTIDESHTGIYIADVSGHGVAASMLTVFLHSTLDKKTTSPSKALEKLYQQFNCSKFDQGLYITVFYAVIDTANYKITFSNAGHNVSPVLFNKGRFELLRVPGIPISNWLDEPGYCDKTLPLLSGDKLFFYTDGVVELRNNRGEQYGEERILDILFNSSPEPDLAIKAIIDSACKFADMNDISEIPDDITMALVEIK